MHSVFVSDLHLAPERPQINQVFFAFTRDAAPQADALYILGDLFEYWVGDDDLGDPFNAAIADALRDLSGNGTALYFMHGDTLCTGDVEYQKFRVYAHDPENQRKFLAQPLPARRQQMLGMRTQSERSKQSKPADIMDVAPAAVEQALRRHGHPRLIHGHTHRPARHLHVVDGHHCERWVLNDWYERGGYLRCDAAGCAAVSL